MKVYIGKKLILVTDFFFFQIFTLSVGHTPLSYIYLIPIFFKEGCLFFDHQRSVLSLRLKTYNIVFPDTIKSIFNLFWFFQEYRFFTYGRFLDFLSNDYFIPKMTPSYEEHSYVEIIIKKTTEMLWERREELSTFQYLVILIFKLHSSIHGIFEPFDLTVASEGKQTFLTCWLNTNIKLFPFLFLLFLTGLPFTAFVIKPLGFLSISTSSIITPLIFLYLILVFYMIKVYGFLLVRVFINLIHALHIRNVWQSFKYAWKLPFLISLSFYSLFLFSAWLSPFNFPFVIILFLFSNLRFFVFTLGFHYIAGIFFPFTRSISNFFQKRIDKVAMTNSESFKLFSSFYGEAAVIQRHAYLSYYEQYFNDNFLFIFVYFWFILVPSWIFNFFNYYFKKLMLNVHVKKIIEILKPYW